MSFSIRCAVCFVSLVCIVGCSEVQRLDLPQAKLQGTVTYKGKPVPHALVVVASSTAGGGGGSGAQGFADKNGKFIIENVSAGPVIIGVNTDAGRGNMMSAVMAASKGGDKSAAPNFVDVPKKYFEPSSSGITTQINEAQGMNSFDIKLD